MPENTNQDPKKGSGFVKRVKRYILTPIWWAIKKAYRVCFSTLEKALITTSVVAIVWVLDHFFNQDKFYAWLWNTATNITLFLAVVVFVFFCGLIGHEHDLAKKKERDAKRSKEARLRKATGGQVQSVTVQGVEEI